MTRMLYGFTSFLSAVSFVLFVTTDYVPDSFTVGLMLLAISIFFAILTLEDEGGRANGR